MRDPVSAQLSARTTTPASGDKPLLLRPSKGANAVFPTPRRALVADPHRPDKNDRPAGARVLRALSGVVGGGPAVEIYGDAGIKTPVAATDDVDVPTVSSGHTHGVYALGDTSRTHADITAPSPGAHRRRLTWSLCMTYCCPLPPRAIVEAEEHDAEMKSDDSASPHRDPHRSQAPAGFDVYECPLMGHSSFVL